jgi:hypothetical protein
VQEVLIRLLCFRWGRTGLKTGFIYLTQGRGAVAPDPEPDKENTCRHPGAGKNGA